MRKCVCQIVCLLKVQHFSIWTVKPQIYSSAVNPNDLDKHIKCLDKNVKKICTK